MSYSLEKSKEAVNLLTVVSSPQQYDFFFNFNFGLFSNLLSFSGRFYPPYFFDHTNCVSDHAKFCSREGMWAIVNKYLYPVHKNNLDLRYLFSIFLSETYFFLCTLGCFQIYCLLGTVFTFHMFSIFPNV